MKEYMMIAVLGVAGLLYSCNKRIEATLEGRATLEITDSRQTLEKVAKSAHTEPSMVREAFLHLHPKAPYNDLAWRAALGLIKKGDVTVDETLSVALNPDCFVGKLWLRYDGPAEPPVPSDKEKARFSRSFKQYEAKWHPVVFRLMDENSDGTMTHAELCRTIYKALHQ